MSQRAHVTLVFGDGVHACAAAVNAVSLAHVDASADRVAVATNISNATRAILRHGWRIAESSAPAATRKPFEELAAVLQAPYERVAYWDADHFVLPSAAAVINMQRLWSFQPGKLLASAETYQATSWCFSSGLVVFRPSPARYRAFLELSRNASTAGRKPHPRTPLGRCWDGGYQGLLNALWPENDDKWLLNPRSSPWRLLTPENGVSMGCPTDGRLSDGDQGEGPGADSYHFFGRAAPWGTDCGGCALRGLVCNLAQIERRGRPWQHAVRCGYGAAQAAWYSAFLRLPASIRAECFRRIADPASIERAGFNKWATRGWSRGVGCSVSSR